MSTRTLPPVPQSTHHQSAYRARSRQKSNSHYGTFKFPETRIIDRNGVMRRKFIRAIDWSAPDITEYLRKYRSAAIFTHETPKLT